MKMVTLFKISLVAVILTATCQSLAEETSTSTEISVVWKTETESQVVTTVLPKTTTTKRPRKPFFYGRKFELPKDLQKKNNNSERDKLYSPLITNPIRALPSKNPDTDAETLKQNQNEIFTSIQDFLTTEETTEGSFNKTYFLEDASESENHGGEATTEPDREEASKDGNNSGAVRSRQDGDRSLLVVLPFKADEDNVEEFFTKSPMVKVIENEEELNSTDGTPAPVTREIVTTTEQSFGAKKRWRPSKRYRTTTEAYDVTSTTETGEDATKTYTTYNDVELVTKRYESQTEEPVKYTNHKYETDFVTQNPVYKRFRNKVKKEQEVKQTEASVTTEVRVSSTEKPKEFKEKLKRKGQRRKSTTEGPPKPEELTKILDILPFDVRETILEMGLNKENKEQEATKNNFRLERPPQPIIDPMSYAVFKPLPLDGSNENRNFVPDDMKDFLASFGLLPIGKRVQKSLKVEVPENKTKPVDDVPDVNLDFLPDDLRSLLVEMGLVKSNKKEPTRIHIFNPNNHSIANSEEDLEKLNAILSSIKTTVNETKSPTPEMQSEIIEKIRDLYNLKYKEANLTEINNEIQKISNKTGVETKHRVTSKRATKLNEGPDPLMFSDESLLKNDVKRQDESTNSSSSSSSAAAAAASGGSSSAAASSASSAAGDSSSSSAAAAAAASDDASSSASSSSSAAAEDAETIADESPNIEALKESFGGGETASDDADVESSLPPKRPNGLYLLLDWNTFLEVGTEDDKRRVNLRFQPKIGDSRNFLPVSVP